MAAASSFLLRKRYAVVTGANKGIGFEICKQLAVKGVLVVLTARDEQKGCKASELMRQDGLENVVFHQLDVAHPASVASLAEFIKTHFGKLDILVNNAAVGGVKLHGDALLKASEFFGDWPSEEQVDWNEIATQNYELAEECMQINYYGAQAMVEALAPLLQLSDSPRIVNVSATLGLLKFIPSEWAKGALGDEETLTEERVDEVIRGFLRDLKQDSLKQKGWPLHLSAYKLSKAALNAYTRILANRFSNFLVNSVCPGYVKTDMTCNTGFVPVSQGAENVVTLALLSENRPSGFFFRHKVVSSF